MKRIAYACGTVVAIGALALVLGAQPALGAPKDEDMAKTITVKGEVVDLWCYIDHGAHGADHKTCAIACAKAGNPIGLATADGDLYILMGSEKHQPGSAVALDKMADTVTVTGKLMKKGGLQAIYVESIE